MLARKSTVLTQMPFNLLTHFQTHWPPFHLLSSSSKTRTFHTVMHWICFRNNSVTAGVRIHVRKSCLWGANAMLSSSPPLGLTIAFYL